VSPRLVIISAEPGSEGRSGNLWRQASPDGLEWSATIRRDLFPKGERTFEPDRGILEWSRTTGVVARIAPCRAIKAEAGAGARCRTGSVEISESLWRCRPGSATRLWGRIARFGIAVESERPHRETGFYWSRTADADSRFDPLPAKTGGEELKSKSPRLRMPSSGRACRLESELPQESLGTIFFSLLFFFCATTPAFILAEGRPNGRSARGSFCIGRASVRRLEIKTRGNPRFWIFECQTSRISGTSSETRPLSPRGQNPWSLLRSIPRAS